MKILPFTPETAQPLTAYGSHHALIKRVLRTSTCHAVIIYIEAGGVVAYHQAVENQLFMVVDGEGWVRGDSEERIAIQSGQAAFWVAGEYHESGSDTGMTAIVLEGPDLEPFPPKPAG